MTISSHTSYSLCAKAFTLSIIYLKRREGKREEINESLEHWPSLSNNTKFRYVVPCALTNIDYLRAATFQFI